MPNISGQGAIVRALAAGKAARQTMPRREHAEFNVPERDPVRLLEEQHATRVPDLVSVRIGRMLETPFSFYRGSAAVMAHDLSAQPVSGHRVVACGDAHLANFGLFASPERRLVFDLNDFDEAFPGPWEWDVKRLAASIWLSGRNNGHSEEQCRTATEAAVRSYRSTLRRLYELTAAERFYYQVETDALAAAKTTAPTRLSMEVRKARQRTSEQVLSNLGVTTATGEPRIADQPPIVRHSEVKDMARMNELFGTYRRTLRADTALLLSQFRMVDYALRIVGVGSVGTRCWVFMLQGPGGEALFLQGKEAGRSVLETHGSITDPPGSVAHALTTHGQGYRVVGAQRILQAQSDPFLGWISNVTGNDGQTRDYYIRQFRDMKGSFKLEELNPSQEVWYGELCGRLLARAHSQSPGSAFITGYLGKGNAFDQAVTDWAGRYADQAERDHGTLEKAVRAGRLHAEFGV